jgi:radical SAM superfamily enzyme with C-terminal helix-hairpin-helix motif
MTANAVIIDGYVDEPACLGVPPYISPYIRTVAGALIEHEYEVSYYTIDQIRKDYTLLKKIGLADIAVMIAGVTVPGKYLGGTPAGYSDIRQIGSSLQGPESYLGGPVLFGSSGGGGTKAVRYEEYGFDNLLKGSPATALDALLSGKNTQVQDSHSYHNEDRWGTIGAGIIKSHPLYPLILCEIETARGCSHQITGGCSFCTEPFYGKPVYRSVEGIRTEIAALYNEGARHFRLGRQPDLLSYQSDNIIFSKNRSNEEFPKPQPKALLTLFEAIRSAAPGLETLHIDNINPGTIARHPDEAREALCVIVNHHTPGDVAAFGMETADPAVVDACNLKASPQMMMDAIRIVNEVGGERKDGMPHLLPGLNFIFGLAGETRETYKMNRDFLSQVMKEGLLIRRVNIRQLMPFEGTRAFEENTLPVDEHLFRQFKEDVRKNFDLPMLKKVFPTGTIFRQVIIEESGDTSFGRQLGSYPILIGIPLPLPLRTILDVVVVAHGMRSITALPWPIHINTLPAKTLTWIPGITKKNLAKIFLKRPFHSVSELEKVAGETFTPGLFSYI